MLQRMLLCSRRRSLLTALLALGLTLLGLQAPSAEAQTRFRFPAVDPDGDYFLEKPVVHVDHDPADDPLDVTCTNFENRGFPWCYDEHTGTDYLLRMGFATMDKHDVQVVAAAAGVVTQAVDGNYDRCHAEAGYKVSCDGHPVKANVVTLRHADGLFSQYWHLKKGSVTVAVGQSVACGALLGYVGSSGVSSMPHLHFEVLAADGTVIDPYAGSQSQPQSYWTQQNGPGGFPGSTCQGPSASTTDGGQGAMDASDPPLPSGCQAAAGPGPSPSILLLGAAVAIARRRRRHESDRGRS